MLVYKDGGCIKVETRAPLNDEVVWLRLLKPDEQEIRAVLGEMFQCHPLVIEDCIKLRQRPKVDIYPNHAFITFFAIDSTITYREMAIVIGKNFIITIYQEDIDFIEDVRSEMFKFPARMQTSGRILYHILDRCVDEYLDMVDAVETKIEKFEEIIYHSPHAKISKSIFTWKQKLHTVRRTYVEERNVLGAIMHSDFSYTREEANVYFMDVYDHLSRVIDGIDSFRESLTGLLELQMSLKSDRMNEIMKVLTLVSTFFMPLSFIVGLYGMNIQGIPEYSWKHGYLYVWCLMLTVTGLMWWYFKRKKWW